MKSLKNDKSYLFVRHARAWAWLVGMLSIALCAQRAAAQCSGDITGNHMVDVTDLTEVITSWGNCAAPCEADIDGNGVVNVQDLSAVVLNWGVCPCTAAGNCVSVSPLWCEDWNTGNYNRWSGDYDQGVQCAPNDFSGTRWITPDSSHLSRVTCATADSHRGYGGLRFQGNTMIPMTQNSTGGINAPNGVLVTFNSWLSVPYTFNSTKWLSLMTVTHDCSNAWNQVVTLNIDDSSMRVKPVHVSSVTYASGAPAMPLGQWVRTTVYLNYATGSMHVWQNGRKICSATFSRPVSTMCQWHFGLYASGPNDNITLYEEDMSIVKLNQPLTNFTVEPWFTAPLACDPAP